MTPTPTGAARSIGPGAGGRGEVSGDALVCVYTTAVPPQRCECCAVEQPFLCGWEHEQIQSPGRGTHRVVLLYRSISPSIVALYC